MRRLLFGFTILVISVLGACAPKTVYRDNLGSVFGTTYSFIYQSPIDYHQEIRELLASFNSSLSTFDTGSVISRINRNDTGVVPDSFFLKVFNTGIRIYRQTDGAFDMTVAPLVNAWGFGFSNKDSVSAQLIDSLMLLVGMDKLRLQDGVIVKERPEIMLDASAIAKGYAVDVVAEFFESKGVENYLVEIGGEMRSRGVNRRSEPWRVGIDKPIDGLPTESRDLQMVISFSGLAIATSGNYRNFYIQDGKKFAHIIDPKTGFPVDHSLLSVSIIAQDCMTADAYATACMVMGLNRAREFVEGIKGVEACFIFHSDEDEYGLYMTEGFKSLVIE